jgi:hypothetical protein
VLVISVVIAVLVLREGDERRTGSEATPTAAPSVSSLPSASTDGTSPDVFCTSFRRFADAYSEYAALNDDTSASAVIAAAEELIEPGRPIGLTMGGWLSLLDLVNGTLTGIAGAAPHPVPDDAGEATPDVAARDAYLTTACPA